MPDSLGRTWIAVVLATCAVVLAGAFIVRYFARDVFVPCQGALENVSESALGTFSSLDNVDLEKEQLEVRFDEKWQPPNTNPPAKLYENARVVWTRHDVPCVCGDAQVRWSDGFFGTPADVRIVKAKDDSRYLVKAVDGIPPDTLGIFRKTDTHGRRFQGDRVFSRNHVPMLVFVLALGALAFAGLRAAQAMPYAKRLHAWHTATLRSDGVVESDTGTRLGALDVPEILEPGPILVNPAGLEQQGVYREMLVLSRRHVVSGTHAQWRGSTNRRLRDAHALALVSAVTTLLAMLAHVIGG